MIPSFLSHDRAHVQVVAQVQADAIHEVVTCTGNKTQLQGFGALNSQRSVVKERKNTAMKNQNEEEEEEE